MSIVQAGGAPGLVSSGVKRKFLAPTGVRRPNRPARSEILNKCVYEIQLGVAVYTAFVLGA